MKSAIKPLEIPLASGCAQAASDYASPPAPRTVTNLRLLQRGGLGKRPGARGLAGTTSSSLHLIKGNGSTSYVASPAFVSRVGRAPLLGLDDAQVFAVDEVQGELFEFAGAASTVQPVRLRSGHVSRRANVGFGTRPPAVAVSTAGYVLVAAVEGTSTGGVQSFIDTPDGTRVYSQYKNVSAVQVRAHAVGAVLWLVWQVGTDIRAQSFTPGSSGTTVGSETTIATLGGADYAWDTSAYDGTNWFMTYQSVDLVIAKMTGTTITTSATALVPSVSPVTASVWADPSNARVWVGYHDDPAGVGTVGYIVVAASDLSVVKTNTTIATSPLYGPPLFGSIRHPTTKSDETTRAFYCFRYVDPSGTDRVRGIYTGVARTNGAPSTPIATWHVIPISKPDSRHRVWCITENGTSGFSVARLVLLRFHNEDRGTPVVEASLPGMLAPGATYGPASSAMYFHAIATGSTTTLAALPRVLQTLDSIPLMQVVALEYSTSEQAPWRSLSPGTPSTVVAGQPVEFFASGYGQGTAIILSDLPRTAGASEVGFVLGPTITRADTSSGSSIPAGTYSYRMIYEWADQYGRRHRSEPSAPFSVTLTVARDVNVYATTVDTTQRTSENVVWRPRMVLYRTVDGGTTYHRVGDGAAISFGSSTLFVVDTSASADISDEEILYTDGGVLENNLAPSCRYLARSEDRLWFGGLFTPNLIQCSKVIIPEEPIQCTDHPSHQVVLPGECTGLAYMDGQIAAFTRDSILLINSSSGPNDQGVGEFAPPRLHTTGLGCVDGRSVLETPEGIFFLSQRGLELLPRGFGTVQFVGEAIKDLQQTSLLDQCGFSAYQADKNGSYARFGLMTGSSEFSVPSVRYIATFDLNTAQWFVDDYGSETMGAMGAWPLGFALVRTDLNSNTSPTPIWYEDGSLVSQPETAGASYIDSSIVLNRLWPFGHAGWGKVRKVLITFYSHVANWTLSLTVQTDENTAQTVTWSVTGTGLQWRQLSIVNDECSSIKITISDTDMAVNGAKQAATYLMCALESEAHDGLKLLASGDKQ